MKPHFRLFLALLAILTGLPGYGAKKTFISSPAYLNTASIYVGNSLSVVDADLYSYSLSDTTWRRSVYNISQRGLIELRINNENLGAAYQDRNYMVSVTIDISGNKFNPVTGHYEAFAETKVLKVDYGKKGMYLAEAYYEIPGALNFTATISGFSSFPLGAAMDLELTSKIDVERIYKFNPSTTTSVSANYLTASGQTRDFEISWSNIAGAEFYELEWIYLDNYKDDPSTHSTVQRCDIPFNDNILAHNSTRVVTSGNSYRIPNTFGQGFLLYRVRGIGYGLFIVPASGTSPLTYQYTPSPVQGIWNGFNCTSGCNTSGSTLCDFIGNPVPSTSVSSPTSGYKLLNTVVDASGNEYSVLPSDPDYMDVRKDFNYEYQSVFTEEGKSSTSMKFYDGALLPRQEIARVSSGNSGNLLITETFYDYNGRPAITTLPVPVNDNVLNFKTDLNKAVVTGGSPVKYGPQHFDKDKSACVVGPDPMDPSTGSSRYYSTNIDPVLLSEQENGNYIPVASNYPFVQTWYTPDNTGRIQAKSSPGAEFVIGSGKEMKFYYDVPDQVELDRLFGSEAGDASHYKKNITRDPNGQYSTDFIDLAGKTVATSILGSSPGNLLPLGNLSSLPYSKDLFDISYFHPLGARNLIDPVGKKRVMNRPLFLSKSTVYEFGYGYEGAKFEPECPVPGSVCYDCVLELKISLKDDCGNEYLHGYSNATTKTPIIIGQSILDKIHNNETVACSTSAQPPGYKLGLANYRDTLPDGSFKSRNSSLTDVTLATGMYTLSKSLEVNQEALDFYTTKYLSSSCVKTYHDFETEALATLDLSGCNLTCEACSTQVSAFVESHPGLSEADINDMYTNCSTYCGDQTNNCDIALEELLMDMRPMGQYGQIAKIGDEMTGNVFTGIAEGPVDLRTDALSVYMLGNYLPVKSSLTAEFGTIASFYPQFNAIGTYFPSAPDWRFPYNESETAFTEKRYSYLDENGNIDYVYLVKVGETFLPAVNSFYANQIIVGTDNTYKIKPNYLADVKDFINHFKKSWAKSLIVYHPEYGYAKLCKFLSASYEYDRKMLSVSTFAGAKLSSNGVNQFMNPIGTGFGNPAQDPFFYTLTYSGAPAGFNLTPAMYSRMRDFLDDYMIDPSSGLHLSMAEFAYKMVNCPAGDNANCTSCAFDPATEEFDKISNTADQTWIVYRNLYLSVKREFVEYLLAEYAKTNGFYNGCIGKSMFNAADRNFIGTAYSNPSAGSSTWYNSQFYNPEQPCNCTNYSFYKDKTARFPSQRESQDLSSLNVKYEYDADGLPVKSSAQTSEVIDEIKGITAKQALSKCGQCPEALMFENFFNKLISNNEFVTGGAAKHLICYNGLESNGTNGYKEFTFEMAKRIFSSISGPDITIEWSSVYNPSTHILTGTFTRSDNSESCDINIKLPVFADSAHYTFTDLQSMCCLKGVGLFDETSKLLNGPYAFEFTGRFKIKSGDIATVAGNYPPYFNALVPDQFKEIKINGTSSCFKIDECSFKDQCKASDDAKRMLNFFNELNRASALFPNYPTSTSILINNLLDNTTSPRYNQAFSNRELFNFFSSAIYNQYGTRIVPSQEFSHFKWRVTSIDQDHVVISITNVSDPSYGGSKPDVSCSIDLEIPAADKSSFDLKNIVQFVDMEYTNQNGLQAAVLVETSPGNFSYHKLNVSSPCIPAGYCGDQLSIYDKVVKKSNTGIGYTLPGSDCDECRLNLRYLNPFKDWFNRLLHKDDLEEPYDSTGFLSNTYRWSGYALPRTNPDHKYNMPIGNNSNCNNEDITNLDSIYNPATGLRSVITGCPPEPFDCEITLYTVPDKAIKDVVNILYIYKVPGAPYSSFEMIGETIKGERVTIYGNSPCMNICEMDCHPVAGQGKCDINHISPFSVYGYNYESDFTQEVDVNSNSNYYDDEPTSSNNYPALDAEYSLVSSLSGNQFLFALTPSQSTFTRLWAHKLPTTTSLGVMLEPGMKYVATFSIYYYNDASQPEIDAFMRINGKIHSVRKEKVTLPGISDFIVNYTYYFDTKDLSGIAASLVPMDIWVRNPSNYFTTTQKYQLTNLSVQKTCQPDVPCCEPPPVEFEVISPCSTATEVVKANARIRYEEYIEKTRKDFQAAYVKKCLSAYEGFYMKEWDEKYQYTLYYYDQAGNLVRTIPPKGVNMLSKAEASQVDADRYAGVRTVFTNHDYATTYTYNSLNQLVEQSVPDNKDMDIQKLTGIATGLPLNLTIRAIQKITENKAYLFADGNSSGTYSRIFVTNDGGANWKEVLDIGLGNLTRIQAVSSTIQYAIGEEGLFLKSINGGTSWQVKYIPSVSKLVELSFIDNTNGLVFEESGLFYKTTDGASSWTGSYNSLKKHLSEGVKLTSVKQYYNQIYATTDNGSIYYSKDWGNIWTPESDIRAQVQISSGSFLSDNKGYLAGDKGLLLKGTLSAGSEWQYVNTNLSDDIKEIYFSSELNGCAIVSYIVSSTGYSKLMKTTDGGKSWTNSTISGTIPSNVLMKDIYFISSTVGFAVTSDALVLKTTDGGATWTVKNTAFVISGETAVKLAAIGSQIVFVGGSAGSIYKADLTATTPTWSNYFSTATKPYTTQINDLHALSTSKLLAVYNNSLPALVSLSMSGSTLTYVNLNSSTSGFASISIEKLDFATDAVNGYFLLRSPSTSQYAIGKYEDASAIKLITKSAFQASQQLSAASTFCMNKVNASTGIAAFGSGEILANEINSCSTPGSCNWTDLTNAIRVSNLNDVDYVKDSSGLSTVRGVAIAAGNQGAILVKTYQTPYWTIVPGTEKRDNKLVSVSRPATGTIDDAVVLADGSRFCKLKVENNVIYTQGASGNTIEYSNLTSGSTNYVLNDVVNIANGGAREIYLCGNNSSTGNRAVLSATIGMSYLFSEISISTSFVASFTNSLRGISSLVLSGNTDVFIVGDGGKRLKRSAGAWSEVNTQPDRINATAMATGTIGFAVGAGGKIYKTTDAAATWQLMPPNSPSISVDLNAVHFISPTVGFMVGDNKIYKTTDGGTTFNSVYTYSGCTFTDVHFTGDFGLATATGGKLVYTSNQGSSWTVLTSSGQDLNAVVTTGAPIGSGNGIPLGFAVGNNGTILRILKRSGSLVAEAQTQSGSTTWVAYNYSSYPNSNLYDVYFADFTTGYVIGENGVILKTVNGNNFSNSSSSVQSTWAKPGTSISFASGVNPKAFTSLDGISFMIASNKTSGSYDPVSAFYDKSDIISSRFYYDGVGRLVVSQDAGQYYTGKAAGKNIYSYTLYDNLGRIFEVGEITATSPVETCYKGNRLDNSVFQSWITNSSNQRNEVTRTYYDQVAFSGTPAGTPAYLKNRVASVAIYSTYTGTITAYSSAIHYVYDIHGNVTRIVNDVPELNSVGAQYKVVDYNFDLLTGKVNQVNYQAGSEDQFAHKYTYDEQNRITEVYTSNLSTTFYSEQYHSQWQKDAKYSYLLHGPLARTEIGNDKVQGLDYAYTLQGWMKGMNSATLVSERDMGKDGCNTCSSNPNEVFARDEAGFVLGYYKNDYSAVNSSPGIYHFDAATVISGGTNSQLEASRYSLYNGNISYMVTAIGKFMEGETSYKPQAMVYRYDQLNRLKTTKRFTNISMSGNQWNTSGQTNTDYNEEFSYDANGNITTLKRNGIDYSGSNLMDDFTYRYESISHNQKKNTNKLLSVGDAVSTYALPDAGDIKNGQTYSSSSLTGNNYTYDETGNLIADAQEEIAAIKWNVYGKISEIIRTGGSTKANLEFRYNPSGQRITKIVKPSGSTSADWIYTYYVHDASGNVLSTYTLLGSAIAQENVYLYGSSRLGEIKPGAKSESPCAIAISEDDLVNHYNEAIEQLIKTLFSNSANPDFITSAVDFWRNRWQDYFENRIHSFPDAVNSTSTHMYMWNEWVSWMCRMRCFETLDNSVLGMWADTWEHRMEVFTSGSIGCPIEDCPEVYQSQQETWITQVDDLIGMMEGSGFTNSCTYAGAVYVKGSRHYELSNHLGNVLAVVTDRKIEVDEEYEFHEGAGYQYANGRYTPASVSGTYSQNATADGYISGFVAEVLSATDYYAFGSPMPGRSWQGAEYRYGFNGKEKDDEVKGEGGQQDYGMRIYDSRIGKFLSVDPLTKSFPMLTPFQYASNNPVMNIDIDGKEGESYIFTWFEKYGDAVFDLAKANNFSSIGAIMILGQAVTETGYGTQSNLKYTNNLWNFAPNELKGERQCEKGGRWACFADIKAAFKAYVDRVTSKADLIEYKNPNFNPSYPKFGALLKKNDVPTENAILDALRINGEYGYDPGNNEYGRKLLMNSYYLTGHYLNYINSKIENTNSQLADLESQRQELLKKVGPVKWTLEYHLSLYYLNKQIVNLKGQLKAYKSKETEVKEVRSKLKISLGL